MTQRYDTVSFVIVTQNRAEELARCIASIRNFCGDQHEIIVVDNASTDGTADWVRSQSTLTLVSHQENLGPGGGRNSGVKYARGELVCFLDDDAYLQADILEPTFELFQQRPLVVCVAFPIWEVTLQKQLYGFRTGLSKCFAAGAVCFVRQVYDQLGGFDPEIRWSEEFDLSLRLWGAGYELWTLKEPMVYHEAVASPIKPHPREKLTEITYGRLRAFGKSLSFKSGFLLGSRVILLLTIQSARALAIGAVPAALTRFWRTRDEIQQLRMTVPAAIERRFIVPDELEDEFSVPISTKLWRRVTRFFP